MEVSHFDLVRWARDAARQRSLSRTEAHVLLLLVTYANKECMAWPSIATLADDAGLTVTKDRRNSTISEALGRLQDLQLIWRTQAGVGRSARTALLYKPSADPEGKPSGDAEGKQPSGRPDPSDVPDACLPAERTQKNQGRPRATTTTTTTREKGQRTPSADAEGSRLPLEDDREQVRRLIRESLQLVADDAGQAMALGESSPRHDRWPSLEAMVLDPEGAEALRASVDGEWA